MIIRLILIALLLIYLALYYLWGPTGYNRKSYHRPNLSTRGRVPKMGPSGLKYGGKYGR